MRWGKPAINWIQILLFLGKTTILSLQEDANTLVFPMAHIPSFAGIGPSYSGGVHQNCYVNYRTVKSFLHMSKHLQTPY